MPVPDNPEALFECLAEPYLRQLFPEFDALKPINQKILRLINTEVTKGSLTDASFQEIVYLILSIWRAFNHAALIAYQQSIDTEDEIDTDWVDAALYLARMDEYLRACLAFIKRLPGQDEGGVPPDSRYLFRNLHDS